MPSPIKRALQLFKRTEKSAEPVPAPTFHDLIEDAWYGSIQVNATKAFSLYRQSSAISTAVDLIASKVETITPVIERGGQIQDRDEITDFLARPNDDAMWRNFVGHAARIRPADQWTPAELANFRENGVSVIGANRNFSAMICGEFVTTNTTDPAANPDDSFKFLNTVDTVAAIRDAFFLNFKARYGQTRLTDGALRAGRSLANQASIEAFTEGIFQSLAEDVLVQEGPAALSFWYGERALRGIGLDLTKLGKVSK